MILSDFRQALVDLLEGEDLLPLRGFPPDDVAELPCIVLGSTTLGDGDPGTYEVECPVFVAGRRFGDDDAYDELLRYSDLVLAIFGGSKGRKANGYSFAATSCTPQVVSVGGNDIPAYEVAVTSTVRSC